MSKQNSILVIVTSQKEMPNTHATGLWFEEYAVPVSLFRKNGMQVTVASLAGGQVPIDPKSLPENPQSKDILLALEDLKSARRLSDVKLENFDALFFPGGHGTMFDLPSSAHIGKTIVEFIETDRVVGAVCHGPAAFVGATFRDGTSVVKGRKLTGFTNEEECAVELDSVMPFLLQSKLTELGAEFIATPNWSDNVIVDGKLITGQNPQSSASTAKAMLEVIDAA